MKETNHEIDNDISEYILSEVKAKPYTFIHMFNDIVANYCRNKTPQEVFPDGRYGEILNCAYEESIQKHKHNRHILENYRTRIDDRPIREW